MGSFAFVDATTWIGGFDATGYLNQMAANISAEELDCTPFGSTYRRRTGGLKTLSATYSGFYEAGTGTPDPEFFTNLGTSDRVTTISSLSTETTPAYLYQGGVFRYSPFGQIGQVTPFQVSQSSTNAVGAIRGQVAKAKADVSATGATGSVVNLGQVGAAQFLYATLHVFTAGTTITVIVESDDNANFTSATTRQTIGPITTTGGTWMTRVAGAITDTHYRFNVTAVTGTFSIAGAIGIGS